MPSPSRGIMMQSTRFINHHRQTVYHSVNTRRKIVNQTHRNNKVVTLTAWALPEWLTYPKVSGDNQAINMTAFPHPIASLHLTNNIYDTPSITCRLTSPVLTCPGTVFTGVRSVMQTS